MNFKLDNNVVDNQFVIYDEEKQVGYINYEIEDNIIRLTYIFVNPKYRGQGLTTKLMDYATDIIRDKKLKAIPICPVIKKVIQKPQYNDVL
jgi:predicted GNAT family acetyltransferase